MKNPGALQLTAARRGKDLRVDRGRHRTIRPGTHIFIARRIRCLRQQCPHRRQNQRHRAIALYPADLAARAVCQIYPACLVGIQRTGNEQLLPVPIAAMTAVQETQSLSPILHHGSPFADVIKAFLIVAQHTGHHRRPGL